jgi:hypothetical protein
MAARRTPGGHRSFMGVNRRWKGARSVSTRGREERGARGRFDDDPARYCARRAVETTND